MSTRAFVTAHAYDKSKDALPVQPPAVTHEQPRAESQASGDPARLLRGLESKYAVPPPIAHVADRAPAAAGPAAVKATSPEASAEIESILSAFRAARHALDKVPAGADQKLSAAQVAIANHHVAHADRVADSRQPGNSGAIENAASSFYESLMRYIDRVEAPKRQLSAEASALLALNEAFRERQKLGLYQPQPHKAETKPDVVYTKDSLADAFRIIETRSESLYEQLEALAGLKADPRSEDRRNSLVARSAPLLAESIDYATWLVKQLPPREAASCKQHADRAADRMLRVYHWIPSRVAHASMKEVFDPLVDRMADALARVGAKPMAQRDTPPLVTGEQREQLAEKEELDAAWKGEDGLKAELWSLRSHKLSAGIDLFDRLAEVKDPEREPDFLEVVLKAVLIASLGHIAGGVTAVLAAKVIVSGGALQKLVDITTDSTQGIAGEASEGAMKESAKVEKRKRARAYFVSGLKLEVEKSHAKYEGAIETAIARGEISAAALRREIAPIKAMISESEISQHYLRGAATGWASYLAQSRLGTVPGQQDRTGRKVTNMEGYIAGAENSRGESARHGDGVLRIRIDVDEPRFNYDPDRGPNISLKSTEIVGLNADLKGHVLAGAGGRLDRVWLPKEVMIVSKAYRRALLAINERNDVRDTEMWDPLRKLYPDKLMFKTPNAFWSLVAPMLKAQ